MNLVIFHNKDFAVQTDGVDLREVLSNSSLAGMIMQQQRAALTPYRRTMVLFPKTMDGCLSKSLTFSTEVTVRFVDEELTLDGGMFGNVSDMIVSNGCFITCPDWPKAMNCIHAINTDMVAMIVKPSLVDYRETVRITPDRQIVGFHRTYGDSIAPIPFPENWPHHIWLSSKAVNHLRRCERLPIHYKTFLGLCRSGGLSASAICMAGHVVHLSTEKGLLHVLSSTNEVFATGHHTRISERARIVGPVGIGNNVKLEDRSVVVGPAMIGAKVVVKKDAVVSNSIIGPGLTIAPNRIIRQRVILSEKRYLDIEDQNQVAIYKDENINQKNQNMFRYWPWYSYARMAKRIFDVIGSMIILTLFLPVFPIIAMVIKLTSPGPIFYRARRQGLHGREFDCLKFRSMMIQADAMQEKLRAVNQVDGPQFKMENDPRVSPIGKFLRDTCLDEIPQFLNVLLGQMSIVGPRPSPEAENSQCPFWRDARLSVRPGITGLWQLCRTRDTSRDFQEWVLYDTQYVRHLSIKTDLWIAWKTAQKLVNGFIDQL